MLVCVFVFSEYRRECVFLVYLVLGVIMNFRGMGFDFVRVFVCDLLWCVFLSL